MIDFDSCTQMEGPVTDGLICLYQDGGVDQFDEWVSSGTWSGKKILRKSAAYSMHVWLKIHVSGKRGKNRRLRPVRWHATLQLEHITVELGRGRCKSLLEASKAVRALDTSEALAELLRAFYAREGATCVYVEAERPMAWTVLMGHRFEPWGTLFGRYPDYMQLPLGQKYLMITRNYKAAGGVRLVDRSGSGYSSTSNQEIRELAAGLLPWFAGVDHPHDRSVPIRPPGPSEGGLRFPAGS